MTVSVKLSLAWALCNLRLPDAPSVLWIISIYIYAYRTTIDYLGTLELQGLFFYFIRRLI